MIDFNKVSYLVGDIMRIKDTVNHLIEELEGENYVFDYLFKKNLRINLEYCFKDYYDIGTKQFKQITAPIKKKINISPTISRISLSYIANLVKSIFIKKERKIRVITQRAFLNYDHFYSFVTEAINNSDLYKKSENDKITAKPAHK